MNNVESLYSLIDKGREGKNIGLSTGISTLDKYIGGVQKSIYTLIFGLSGSSKTAVAIYSYIYRPLRDHLDKNIRILYYSLELSAELLLAKLLCLYIYEEFDYVISYRDLMSWKDILNDESYQYVLKGRAWLDSISDKLVIYDKTLTSKSFYNTTLNFLSEYGEFKESEDGRRKIYIEKDPEQLIEVIIDHIGLVRPSDGRSSKEEMDLVSSYMVTLRERCHVSFVVLQQENRNASDTDRIKMGMSECSLDGLKATGK